MTVQIRHALARGVVKQLEAEAVEFGVETVRQVAGLLFMNAYVKVEKKRRVKIGHKIAGVS